jgi:WD40 repeat protein
MRCGPVTVVLALVALVATAADDAAKPPRLDVIGDPLPDGAIARLGTTRFQPPDYVRAAARSWDGRSLALSPDGASVAMTSGGGKAGTRIHFLDTRTGKTAHKYSVSNVDGERIQFSADGKTLILGDRFGLTLIDAATGKLAGKIEFDEDIQSEVALSPDGRWVAAQMSKFVSDAPVGVWDAKTGSRVASLPGRGASCKGLAFGPDGKRLLLWSVVPSAVSPESMSFGPECTVSVVCIDVTDRRIVGEVTVGNSHRVALSPDGESVALEATDHQSVRVRHLPTKVERCALRVAASEFAFGPDGKSLVAVDPDSRAALWDATTGKKVRDLDVPLANKDFRLLGISKDGRIAVAIDGGWDSDAAVVVWDTTTGRRANRPSGHAGAVTCLAYSPNGKLLASGSLDKTVRLWNPATGEQRGVLTGHTGPITAVVFTPDGKLLASSSQSGQTRLSTVTDGKTVADFAGPERGATALAFSSDGTLLFAGGHSPEIVGWDTAGGKAVARLTTGEDGAVMGFTSGGGLAVTANGEVRAENTPEQLKIWKPTANVPVISIPIRDGERGSVLCERAVFSPDGRMLASSQVSEYQGIRPSYGAAQLRLWETASGRPIRTLSPTVTSVLAFSPGGRLLAAGAPGRSGHLSVGYGFGIDIWDTLTGERAGELPVTPQCVAFSPDGQHLATGGRDCCVLIWDAPTVQPPKPVKAPSAAEREAWCAALSGDAEGAYQAIGQMTAAPESALEMLKDRVRPVPPSDPDAVAKLIARLDSGKYAEREEARAALQKLGDGAAHLLVKALDAKVSPEVRGWLESLLADCEATSISSLRHHRVIAPLEQIGTPAARSLLRTLADGAPRARLTTEASAALKRLGE